MWRLSSDQRTQGLEHQAEGRGPLSRGHREPTWGLRTGEGQRQLGVEGPRGPRGDGWGGCGGG